MDSNEIKNFSKESTFTSSIAPWLSVRNSEHAAGFYKSAFGAIETYRLDNPDGGPVLKLSVGGAEFWLSEEFSGDGIFSQETLGGGSIRLILTVPDPDTMFAKALEAGASEVFPVGEEHGWRLGRLADPFGLHWEIGHPLATPGDLPPD
ncbi:MAG: VOC family protein [Ferruginibacter sp.]